MPACNKNRCSQAVAKSLLDAADAIAAVAIAVNADALSHITTSPHLLLSIYQYNTLGNNFFLRNYNFPELLTYSASLSKSL